MSPFKSLRRFDRRLAFVAKKPPKLLSDCWQRARPRHNVFTLTSSLPTRSHFVCLSHSVSLLALCLGSGLALIQVVESGET